MENPIISSKNLADMTHHEKEEHYRLIAERKRSLIAKIQAIDIFADDISGLSDEEIALGAEYWYLKKDTEPDDPIPYPRFNRPETVILNAELDRLKPQYDWVKGKTILQGASKERLNQCIRRQKIMQKMSIKMRRSLGSPFSSLLCAYDLLPDNGVFYMCRYIAYKQQSAIFHMVFSNEFCKKSIPMQKHQVSDKLDHNLGRYEKTFFDKEYILKNKKKVFRQPEYFLVFTNGLQSEYDRCLNQMINDLSIPKKKLVENVNLVSLWDYCPQLSRVVDYRKGNMKRFIKKLTRGLRERGFTVSNMPSKLPE